MKGRWMRIKGTVSRSLLIVLIGLSAVIELPAQTPFYDSLRAVWKDQSRLPQDRMKALRTLIVQHYFTIDQDSTLYFAEKMLELAKEVNDSSYQGIALNILGSGHSNWEEDLKGLEYLRKSAKLKEQIGDSAELGMTYGNISQIYLRNKLYDDAAKYGRIRINLALKLQDTTELFGSFNSMGVNYYFQEEYDSALFYFRSLLDLLEEFSEEGFMVNTYRCFALGNIGEALLKLGELEKAYEMVNGAIRCIDKLPENEIYFNSGYIALGNYHNLKNNYDSAIYYCKKAYTYFDSRNLRIQSKDACDCLYEAYKASGDSSSAVRIANVLFEIQKNEEKLETRVKLKQEGFRVVVVKDSLEHLEKERAIIRAHEEEVRANKKKRNIAILLGIFAFVVALAFYLRYRLVHRANREISRAREQSDKLLLNILPAEIAEELKEKGEATARGFDQVSIIFTDFKDFTRVSQDMSADELVKEVNVYFKKFDDICEECGVEKIKTIGDSYMAVSGLPVPAADSTEKAVLAALKMLKFVKEQGDERFQMRCGIHSGHVVAGIVGVKKFQYDVWGDTVNTASRIESDGEAGKLNISYETYELIKDNPNFIFEDRGVKELAGKGALRRYFVSLT